MGEYNEGGTSDLVLFPRGRGGLDSNFDAGVLI